MWRRLENLSPESARSRRHCIDVFDCLIVNPLPNNDLKQTRSFASKEAGAGQEFAAVRRTGRWRGVQLKSRDVRKLP